MSVSRMHRYCIVALAALTLASSSAHAQAPYPNRPIRMIVASGPAGVHDVIGRVWAEQIKSALGTIVIDNRGGAGGSIGIGEAARAPRDGYTLLLGSNSTHIIHPLVAPRTDYDPIRDLAPVTVFALTSTSIAVHPAAPAKTLGDLIAYAKANPGKLSYAHGGTGGISHIGGEMFKQLAGKLDILAIPYKGVGGSLADVLSGNVPMLVPNITGQIIELHRTGKIRILAVNAPARHPLLPEVPTAIEAGVPGLIAQNFFGVFAPTGTPQAIVERISDATQAALAEPAFQKRLADAGFEPIAGLGPEKSAAYVKDEYARWLPIVRAAGIMGN